MLFKHKAAEYQTILELLKRGRDKVSKGWTQGVYARDGINMEVPLKSKFAEKFCAMGGLRSQDEYVSSVFPYMIAALPDSTPRVLGVKHYNDEPGRKKEEILALYDRASELVEADFSELKGVSE